MNYYTKHTVGDYISPSCKVFRLNLSADMLQQTSLLGLPPFEEDEEPLDC